MLNFFYFSVLKCKYQSEEDTSSVSSSSKISTRDMELVVEKLVSQQTRKSTAKTYLNIWRHFYDFVLSLDVMPPIWEHRTTLYLAHLIQKGRQSSSIKSYVSAIKKMLVMDKYKWNDEEVLLHSLTKVCKLINDRASTRLPIHFSLLEMILFEVHRIFGDSQPYLEGLYKALYILSYYGMMGIGEVTSSEHVLRAQNVHVAQNKDKMLFVLYTSKTHGLWARPQKIKITSERYEKPGSHILAHRNFCPFQVLRHFLKICGDYLNDSEPFFIFRDRTPVTLHNASHVLKKVLVRMGIDSKFYSMHSFCIGRTSDLVRFGYSLEEVKRLGRWRSNVVYKYIRS